LEAKRLAAAGRHDGDNIVATQNEIDDFALCGPEIVKSKTIPKEGASVHALRVYSQGGQQRTEGGGQL
jgi:hypothetical protein